MAKGDYFGPDIRMDVTPLLKGVVMLDRKLDNGVAGVFEYYDSRIETHMKSSAPWTDRTGNARSGLRAKAGHAPFKSHWIDLWHSVPYGIWLEVRFAGRYAIVIPTIVQYGPKIMGTLNKLFARLGGS
jgi:hypothetical protein